MACLECGRGFCVLCGECECCAPKHQSPSGNGNPDSGTSHSTGSSDSKKAAGNSRRSRTPKRNDNLKDPHSTGRKRAASLFPLKPDNPCEWQGKTYCGGGQYPIVGCITGKQQARHHGPDKNTLNNAPKNVHRICDDCHNIWHSQNDPTYDSYWAKKEHEPRAATNLELINRETRHMYIATKEADPDDNSGIFESKATK